MKRFTIDEIYSKKDKKERSAKIRKIIIYIIIIPLLVYNAIILFQVFANGNTTPNVFGYKTFVIISGSMTPELEIGDIAVVKNASQSELKVGDIISFREGNSIVTHRITEITDEGKYKTKGDANNSEDINAVDFNDIEGRFVTRIQKLGYLIIFIQNKMGIFIVAILLYTLYIVNKNGEERKMERKEKREIYEKLSNDK